MNRTVSGVKQVFLDASDINLFSNDGPPQEPSRQASSTNDLFLLVNLLSAELEVKVLVK